MRGTVLYGPRDVRFEDREAPRIGADSVLECVGSEESMSRRSSRLVRAARSATSASRTE